MLTRNSSLHSQISFARKGIFSAYILTIRAFIGREFITLSHMHDLIIHACVYFKFQNTQEIEISSQNVR